MQMTTDHELLTLAEAAELLGITRGTLYNWRRAEYGPACERTNPIVYSRAVVLRWKANRNCSKCGRTQPQASKDSAP